MTDDKWNKLIVVSAIFFLALVLGFSLGASFSAGCAPIKDAPFGCIEWWLSRYQTLIAMFGALLAAALAARPVWKQLTLSSMQTTAAMQQVYTAREKLLENRTSELTELKKLSDDLNWYERVEDDPGATHWVWDMGQRVDGMHDQLVRRQAENIDGDQTTSARQALIHQLRVLADCMRNFNATVSIDDPELDATPEMEAEAAAAEAQAARELPDRISDMSMAVQKLRDGFKADLVEIRLKRQLLDQVLINAKVTH